MFGTYSGIGLVGLPCAYLRRRRDTQRQRAGWTEEHVAADKLPLFSPARSSQVRIFRALLTPRGSTLAREAASKGCNGIRGPQCQRKREKGMKRTEPVPSCCRPLLGAETGKRR